MVHLESETKSLFQKFLWNFSFISCVYICSLHRAVLVVFIGLVTFGTLYTALTRSINENKQIIRNNSEGFCTKTNFGISININYLNYEELKRKKRVADRFWHCFALQKNNKFIMSSKLSKDSLPPIHGIRTIGILWIIIGRLFSIENK